MNKNYSHAHIWINGRMVRLQDILADKAEPKSEFEKNTFTFASEWLSSKDKFELQTSGSTGSPKTINVKRSQMTASANLTAQALGLQQAYHALVSLDTRYVAGKMMMVRSFETGMKIFAIDPCANPLGKIPTDQPIHFTALVPYQLKTILESKHTHLLESLSTCIVGGAPLDESLQEQLQFLSVPIFITYGMTETISHIALQPVNGHARSIFYQTLPGITVRQDQRNCLVINAPYLPDEIITNDIVEVQDEKTFRWLGRWDNIINTGGVKVSPENIEETIGKIFTRLHISIPFFIYGVPDERLGQKVVLVLQSSTAEISLREIRNALVHSISIYEMPKEFFITKAFVYTNTNKINRHESFKTALVSKPIPD
jgi:O-succinylbenzoic acid--CoA ligase